MSRSLNTAQLQQIMHDRITTTGRKRKCNNNIHELVDIANIDKNFHNNQFIQKIVVKYFGRDKYVRNSKIEIDSAGCLQKFKSYLQKKKPIIFIDTFNKLQTFVKENPIRTEVGKLMKDKIVVSIAQLFDPANTIIKNKNNKLGATKLIFKNNETNNSNKTAVLNLLRDENNINFTDNKYSVFHQGGTKCLGITYNYYLVSLNTNKPKRYCPMPVYSTLEIDQIHDCCFVCIPSKDKGLLWINAYIMYGKNIKLSKSVINNKTRRQSGICISENTKYYVYRIYSSGSGSGYQGPSKENVKSQMQKFNKDRRREKMSKRNYDDEFHCMKRIGDKFQIEFARQVGGVVLTDDVMCAFTGYVNETSVLLNHAGIFKCINMQLELSEATPASTTATSHKHLCWGPRSNESVTQEASKKPRITSRNSHTGMNQKTTNFSILESYTREQLMELIQRTRRQQLRLGM